MILVLLILSKVSHNRHINEEWNSAVSLGHKRLKLNLLIGHSSGGPEHLMAEHCAEFYIDELKTQRTVSIR